jgi:hypothetical protein
MLVAFNSPRDCPADSRSLGRVCLLAILIAIAVCAPLALAQGDIPPLIVPGGYGLSFELEKALQQEQIQFPSVVRDQDRERTRGQIMVGAWMQNHSSEIASAERRFHVTRQAIAGVIAWEALRNVTPGSVRAVGPGKVHICNMSMAACETALRRFCGLVPGSKCPANVKGIDETVGQEVESLGYLPPKSLQERIEALKTSSGAIMYIGAILRAGADAAKEAGWDIDNNPAKLAEFYRGYTVRSWRLALETIPKGSEKLILRDKNGNEKTDEMGEWIEQNTSFIEDGVGKPGLKTDVNPDESILGSIPADSVESRKIAQARNNDYESWLRQLEATVSRAEEARAQERAEIEFNRELVRQAGTFGYLAAAAGLACSNPDALVAEVSKGRYGSVGMERQFLSAYLAAVSDGSGLSPCQLELLNKINNAGGPVSWRDLHTWGGQYRAAHPTVFQRIERSLKDFLDAFAIFDSPGGGSDGGSSSGPERPERQSGGERPERHSPDPLETTPGRQLRGINSGGWN